MLAAVPVWAQETASDELASGAYVAAAQFTRADGMPSDYVTTLYRDTYGFLWIGTDVGVARFDGARFEAYGTAEGLPDGFVTSITEDGAGVLWVATYEGLARLRRSVGRGRFEAVPMPFQRRGDVAAAALSSDAAGRLLIAKGHAAARLMGFDDPADPATAQWHVTPTSETPMFASSIAALADGGFVSRGDSLHLVVAPPVERPGGFGGDHGTVSAPPAQRVRTPPHWGQHAAAWPGPRAPGDPPSAWFYAASLGPLHQRSPFLYRCAIAYTSGAARLVVYDSTFVGLASEIHADPSAPLALLTILRPERRHQSPFVVPPDDSAPIALNATGTNTAILTDDEQSVWVGSFGEGLRQHRPSVLNPLVNEPTERVAMRSDPDGVPVADAPVYATTQTRIARVDPETLAVSDAFGFGNNRQRGITVAPDGRVSMTWVVNFSVPTRPDGVTEGTALSATAHRYANWYADVEVRGDTLTAATYGGGVMRFLTPGERPAPADIARLDTLTLGRGLPTAMTERLVRLPSGLYVLTRSHGAWRLPPVRDHRAEPLGLVKSLGERSEARPSYAAYSLYEDASGTVWIGTDRGVLRVRADSTETFGADLLRGHRVTSLFERPGTPGLVWLTGDRYLYHLDPATGIIRRYGALPLVLDRAATINDVRYHPATDRLFLATTHHLLAADLGRLDGSTSLAPRLALTAIRLDDADATPEGSPLAARLVAEEPGARRVEVAFAPLSLAQSVTAEYRLGDAPWRALGAEREVVFSDLKPGVHTLAVRAVAPGPVVGEAATLRLTLPPHWWQRGLVRMLFALALVAVVIAVTRAVATRPYRRQLRALELEQKLRGERERISRDLHDHVGAQVTHLIAEIEEARLAEASPESTLDRLDADARATLDQLRETVWALKDEALSPHALGARIERFAARQCERSGLACAVRLEGTDADLAEPLPPGHSLHLYRIAQEAITNAAKHSGGTRVVATLRRTPGGITLTVTDDGTFRPPAGPPGASGDGAPASVPPDGFGLAHLRERATTLGGTLTLDTDGGTTVHVQIPLDLLS